MLAGGAGVADCAYLDTDVQDLRRSVVPVRVQMGKALCRGLACGGDGETGHAAAIEDRGAIIEALSGPGEVVLLVALGGGAGSGASPVVCELARAGGALVRAVVTLPRSFEGRRRARLAAETLVQLRESLGAGCVVVGEEGPPDGVRLTMVEHFAQLDAAMAEGLANLH